jgi:hypothetical protein
VGKTQHVAGTKGAAAKAWVYVVVFHPQHLPPSGQAARAIPLGTRSAGMGEDVAMREIIRGR